MRSDETLDQATAHASVEQGRRRPFWMVGLALLGLVVVFLAGAFLLDKQLRGKADIETPPVVATIGKPADAPVAIVPPTVQSTVAPTATVPALAPTSTAGPGGPGVATSPLEGEIEAAYLHYWDVLAQAYLDADSSHLTEVMSDPELSRQRQEIGDLKSQGKAAKLVVDHHIAFVKVSPDSSIVYDEYLNHSVFVDLTSKQERPTSAPPETEKISFEIRKIDGSWKVVDGTRQD